MISPTSRALKLMDDCLPTPKGMWNCHFDKTECWHRRRLRDVLNLTVRPVENQSVIWPLDSSGGCDSAICKIEDFILFSQVELFLNMVRIENKNSTIIQNRLHFSKQYAKRQMMDWP